MKDIQKIKEFFSKPLEEATFKVGDKVTYLDSPGEITGVSTDTSGRTHYSVSYKGNTYTGRRTARGVYNKSGEIKMASPSLEESKKDRKFLIQQAKDKYNKLQQAFLKSDKPSDNLTKQLEKAEKEYKDLIKPMNENEETNEGGGTLKIEKQKDGKYYWTFTFKSGKVEKWPNGFNTSAEAQKDFMYGSKFLKSVNEAKSEDGYEVVWVDRNYNEFSKKFKNDPLSAPENAKVKAEKFIKLLNDKDKKSEYGLFRDIKLKSLYKDLSETKLEDKFKKNDTVYDKHTKAKLKVTRILKDRIYTVPFNFPGRAEEWYKAEELTTKSFFEEATDYIKRRQAQDDYTVNKKDKPKKSYNPTPSGKTDYMKRREKELTETIFNKLKK